MTSVLIPDQSPPGFVFENIQRNTFLQKQSKLWLPTARKTGTTICGVIFKDGVVLGADTRATGDTIVADKNCSKIHYLAKNMYCCGAGTAADTEVTTNMIASQLELHRLRTGREVPVVTANRMLKQMLFRYQGYIGAALVLAGVDNVGPHLISIYPHGSTDALQYTSMGSGSLACISVLEAGWKPEMDEESAKKLVRDGIAAGVFNDLASGNTIDICVIKKGSVNYIRPYEIACTKGQRVGSYKFKPGTTAVLTSIQKPIIIENEEVRHIEPESMDTSA